MLPRLAVIRSIGFAALLLTTAMPLLAQAQFVYGIGSVTVHRGGSTFTPHIGSALEQGDVISTASGATAIVQLNSNTEVKMRESTDFRIEGLGTDMVLNLERGGLFSNIIGKLEGSFSIRAGNVVSGVRGTEYFIAYGKAIGSAPDVWLCVNRGTVAVAVEGTDQTVDIHQGMGINVLAGSKITPPKAYGWTKELNWNMDPGHAPVQDSTNLNQAYSDLLNQDYD